jgi:phosphonoacetaldehyde hydrolase
MLDFLVTSSAHRGFNPDCSISPEDVGPGRPQPFMIFENAVRLQVYPLASIAKIGDTAADIEEGLNAGVWSIGVAGTGNMVGLTKADLDALSDTDRSERLRTARAALEDTGAHYVIDTLDQLHDVLDDINLKLRLAAVHT